MSDQPIISNIDGKRKFVCSAVGLSIFIINDEERILLLSSPPKRKKKNTWEVISGALETKETVLEGSLREIREEIGPDVKVRPLGTIHAYTFHYDDRVQYMIGICNLMAYEGGVIKPSDDMRGSEYHWWSIKDIEEENIEIVIPGQRRWLFKRSIELYRLWKDNDLDLIQLELKPKG